MSPGGCECKWVIVLVALVTFTGQLQRKIFEMFRLKGILLIGSVMLMATSELGPHQVGKCFSLNNQSTSMIRPKKWCMHRYGRVNNSDQLKYEFYDIIGSNLWNIRLTAEKIVYHGHPYLYAIFIRFVERSTSLHNRQLIYRIEVQTKRFKFTQKKAVDS